MKSSLIFAFLLIVALSLRNANAALSIGFFKDPAHPGKCVIKPNLILKEGEEGKDPNATCVRVTCRNGQSGETEFATCGVRGLPEGCKATDYLYPDQPYPKCCEQRIECANK